MLRRVHLFSFPDFAVVSEGRSRDGRVANDKACTLDNFRERKIDDGPEAGPKNDSWQHQANQAVIADQTCPILEWMTLSKVVNEPYKA